jgi:hypothetical protein
MRAGILALCSIPRAQIGAGRKACASVRHRLLTVRPLVLA